VVAGSAYRPQVPARPTLTYLPQLIPCQIPTTDTTPAPPERTCVVIEAEDWGRIREWYLTLERELITACLAAGGSHAECRAQ